MFFGNSSVAVTVWEILIIDYNIPWSCLFAFKFSAKMCNASWGYPFWSGCIILDWRVSISYGLMSAMRTLFRKSINWESPRCLIISVNSNILKIFHRDSKFCQSFYNLHLLVSLLLMVIEKNHHLQWLLYLKMVHWWQKFHFIFSFNLRWTKHSKSLDTIGILLIVITFKSENLFLKLDFILSFGGSKVFPKVTDWYI